MDERRTTFRTLGTRRCASCGGTSVAARVATERFLYGAGKDAVELAAEVRVFRCEECRTEFTDRSAEDARHAAVCRHLGVLSSAEIRQIRNTYGLSRADFARITGVGEASLGRWERSELIQSRAFDCYLRLLKDQRNFDTVKTGFSPPAPKRGGSVIQLRSADRSAYTEPQKALFA